MKRKPDYYDEVLTDMHWDNENFMWYKSITVRFMAMILSVVAIILSILSMRQ